MSARRRTIAGVYGTDAVHELAEIAIDLLCDPPVEPGTPGMRAMHGYRVKVDWELVKEGREIMEAHGIHWKALKADNERPARAWPTLRGES